ncbi:MAG: hypothetical protein ABOK23_06175 [Candidatus Methanoperedens sp.]|nr:hypothetical protein [Candidatus Methanoperedens sp.]
MRLSKNNLLIIWIVPIIFGLIIIYNFWTAIQTLLPRGMSTYLIYNQLAVIGAAVFIGGAVYWSVLVYYIHLIQENEVVIQDNFTQLAGSGTAHLESAKKLITKVLEDIKAVERKPQQ